MIALLGTLANYTALGFAILLTVRGFMGLFRPERARAASFKVPAIGLLVAASVSMLVLEVGLLADDFSVEYIANHSAAGTPLLYKIASAWGALEGSLVLWGLVLSLFVFFIWRAMRRLEAGDALWAGALGVMGVISVFFFFMLVSVSNPFEVCTATGGFGCAAKSAWPFSESVAAAHGLGPNPLLQNHPLMAVHPPTLYIGYVGMSAPFAFAMASLLLGESGDRWLRVTRSWTRIAWIFLTAGIVLGGLWSYEVLGWGGYWAWDPVENASFMPWLVATMFVHTAALQMRRGVLQAWSYALVIATFALTILGTFLTRSGVINSVHSFTQSPIGPVLLWFLMFVLVAGFGVYAARIERIGSAPRLDSLLSREGAFMVNNLLLGLLATVVLVGTLYPLFVEWASGDQVGVGRPFFDRMAVPIALTLLAAMAIGPVAPYRKARGSVVWKRIRNPLRFALAAAALTALFWSRTGWILLTVLLSAFVVGTVGRQWWDTARRGAGKRGVPVWREMLAVARRDSAFWGGQIAHVGVAVLALGIAVSANRSLSTNVDLAAGETASFAGFEITYDGPFARDEGNRTATGATLEIRRGDDVVTVLEPALHQYELSQQTVATPAVDTGLRGDLYTSLARIDGAGITLDLYWFPFIWLVWAGGFLAAAGGIWAWLVKGRRRTARSEDEEMSHA
jgi:cytochrome c-type biogenesis protein CcmF